MMEIALKMAAGALMWLVPLWVVHRFRASRQTCLILGVAIGVAASWLDRGF